MKKLEYAVIELTLETNAEVAVFIISRLYFAISSDSRKMRCRNPTVGKNIAGRERNFSVLSTASYAHRSLMDVLRENVLA